MTQEERLKNLKTSFRNCFILNSVGKGDLEDGYEFLTDKLAELQVRVEHFEKYGQNFKK